MTKATLACIFNGSLWQTKAVDISCIQIVFKHTYVYSKGTMVFARIIWSYKHIFWSYKLHIKCYFVEPIIFQTMHDHVWTWVFLTLSQNHRVLDFFLTISSFFMVLKQLELKHDIFKKICSINQVFSNLFSVMQTYNMHKFKAMFDGSNC